MGRKKKGRTSPQWESVDLNNETYLDYYYRLKELALSVFEWKNLPPSVDERFLELMLYEKGYCLYFNDEVMGNLALSCTIGGKLDVYRNPMFRKAYATNGYTNNKTSKDSVIIYNNYLRTPTDLTIRLFARRLYELERTTDVNVKAQKTPVMVLASDTQRYAMLNMYMQYDGNEPYIFGDKDQNFSDLKVLQTNAPFVADKLIIAKHNIWNEALTFLGIENSNGDKKERLVADEVGGNYGNVEAQRNVMLNARREAVKKINAMFGTNIEVGFRSNLVTMVNQENISRETFDYNEEMEVDE